MRTVPPCEVSPIKINDIIFQLNGYNDEVFKDLVNIILDNNNMQWRGKTKN